jgi:multisubunit Na+/H+ antiporter MnhB subunit
MAIGLGLLLIVLSGAVGTIADQPFLTGVWFVGELPLFGHVELGTPSLFDVGVFMVVLGVTLMIMFCLEQESEEEG